jgi:hypothetical protein
MWTPEHGYDIFIELGVVNFVGIGFEIVFLSPIFLEIWPFSMHDLGHVSYIRVTWQPESEFGMSMGQGLVNLMA